MARAVRFIHAADLHLDAPFKGVNATDERVRQALVASTYDALSALVDACIERSVDFLVVAGDAYNSRDRSVRAQFAFKAAMERLADAGIRVYAAAGNHDPTSGWTAGLALPDNVRVFSDAAVERIVVEDGGEPLCAVYGRSYRRSAETADLARDFSRVAEDDVAIAVLHTNVGGRTEHEPYAPSTLAELQSARMDYWALGHIHKPEVLTEQSTVAVYAGCTQGLNPNEAGPRGCYLVTVGGGVSLEFVPTAAVVWDRRTVDATELPGVGDVRAALAEVCADVRRDAGGRPAIVRIALEGRSDAHADLARPGVLADLVDDLRAEQLDIEPWVWVDRVRDLTRQPVDLAALRESEEFAGDLVRLSDERLADAATIVHELLAPVAEYAGRDLETSFDATSIVERARDAALDRLLAEEGS